MVVWLIFEPQVPTIPKIFEELVRAASAKISEVYRDFLLLDFSMLFTPGVSLQTLPGKLSEEKVDKHIPDGFQVVSTGQFLAQVCMDRGISCCTGQRFVVTVWNMLFSRWVKHPLGKAHINDMHDV